MIKRVLLAGAALCIEQVVIAQTAGVPIPGLPPFVNQPHELPDFGQQEVIGDGLNTTPWGGDPPIYATMPANIPTPNANSYISSGGISLCGGPPGDPLQCLNPDGSYRAPQPKARFTFVPCPKPFFGYFDPQIYHGQPDTGHLHFIYGNCGLSPNSTYQTLRSDTKSAISSPGQRINQTGYWFPPICMQAGYFKFGDGNRYCNIPSYITGYYEFDGAASAAKAVFSPRGLTYTFGFKMNDPDDLYVKSLIAAGNAKPGNAGRYHYTFNGFLGYLCVVNGVNIKTKAGTDYSISLALADGSNPWPDTCKGMDGAGVTNMEMIQEFNGGICIDGRNLQGGASGQGHIYYQVYDSHAGKNICFNNHYHMAGLVLKISYRWHTTGEWVNYELASDQHMRSVLAAQGSSTVVLPGMSGHGDWFGAWDDDFMRLWQKNIGVMGGREDGRIFELNDSTISPTQRLPNPTYALRGTLNAAMMWKMPATINGPDKPMVHH